MYSSAFLTLSESVCHVDQWDCPDKVGESFRVSVMWTEIAYSSWGIVIVGKLIVIQRGKIFSALYGTRRFVTGSQEPATGPYTGSNEPVAHSAMLVSNPQPTRFPTLLQRFFVICFSAFRRPDYWGAIPKYYPHFRGSHPWTTNLPQKSVSVQRTCAIAPVSRSHTQARMDARIPKRISSNSYGRYHS
jgi:hypothetical protein